LREGGAEAIVSVRLRLCVDATPDGLVEKGERCEYENGSEKKWVGLGITESREMRMVTGISCAGW
jgi:hypothetical protein